MNKTKSLLRIIVLFALLGFSMVALYAIPTDDNPAWLREVVLSKALAIAGFYATIRLYKRWSKTDPWIAAYRKMCDEDSANPMYIGPETQEED